MDKYIPIVGDVVLDNGFQNVVVRMINYEDCGSCGYDRKYLFCEEKYIRDNQGNITMSDLENHGRWVRVSGLQFPFIEKVNDIAPYGICQVETYSIKQKVAKTITVFE